MGATGLVGRELLRLLDERSFPCPEVVVGASPASAGRPLITGSQRLTLQAVSTVDFQPGDLVFFTGHDDLAATEVPRAVAAGATVIDNSATFRQHPEVPLIVPEVNGPAAQGHRGLIANPNCTTITFLLPLAVLQRTYGCRWVSVASYQSISGAGAASYEAFLEQAVSATLDGCQQEDPSLLPFNVIPAIGSIGEDGVSSEERKMLFETRKMLAAPALQLTGTAVRVPTLIGHLCAVHVRLAQAAPEVATVRELLAAQAGIVVQDDPSAGQWPTPVGCAGTDPVSVGRIRVDQESQSVAFVAAADNLRKGAALNAVQIAELLLAEGWLAPTGDHWVP